MPEQNSQFAPWPSNLPATEFQNRTTTDNNELLALLFSLTTPATDRTFSFGTNAADNGAVMDIHIHQALYVPSAPKQNDQETVFKLSDMQGS